MKNFTLVPIKFHTTAVDSAKKTTLLIKTHKLPSAIIAAAVIVSVATIGVAALTSNQKPVAMAPVVEKHHTLKQGDVEEVKSATTNEPTTDSSTTPSTSTNNTAASQTKPTNKTVSQKPAPTTPSSSSPTTPNSPSPTTVTPTPSATPSFRIEIRDNQVSTHTFMDWHMVTVPFSIIMDNGFVAKTYEQPFCVLATTPAVDHGVFCEIHQKEADNPGAVVSYKDSSAKGRYTIQARYSINGIVRTDSFSFDL